MVASRRGGRTKGTSNKDPLDKIRENQSRLEKILLDKALTGDVQAIEVCLRRIAEMDEKATAQKT